MGIRTWLARYRRGKSLERMAGVCMNDHCPVLYVYTWNERRWGAVAHCPRHLCGEPLQVRDEYGPLLLTQRTVRDGEVIWHE